MFIRLYEVAKKGNNQKTVDFCIQILETFEKYNINGHIKKKYVFRFYDS